MKVGSYDEIIEVIEYAFSDIYDGLIDELGADNVNSEKISLLIVKAISDEIGKKDVIKLLKKV